MIIYYHFTGDSALLLSFFTNLTPLHPLLFHEMIFILVHKYVYIIMYTINVCR